MAMSYLRTNYSLAKSCNVHAEHYLYMRVARERNANDTCIS